VFLINHSLQRSRWEVSVKVRNIGSINGCDVPQLYLVYPTSVGEPPRVLRDFARYICLFQKLLFLLTQCRRINLDPGDSRVVTFNLSRYDVSVWDVISQKWTVPDGKFEVVIAESSMDAKAITGSFCPGRCA